MEINCGSVELITLQQSTLMCAGGEAGLAALLLLILVKAQLLNLAKECMKLLTDQPKIRGDNCASFYNNAVDASDHEDEEGEEGEEDENEDDDRNPNGSKSDPMKGHTGAQTGGPQENGQDDEDDDEQGDANEDDDDEDDDDGEDGSEEGEGEEGEGEEEDEEEEEEDEEEEEIQPPKKRKK